MKSTFLLFGSLFLSWATFSQTPITINAADMPVPTADLNILEITNTNPPAASLGNNQNWDYGSYVGSSPSSVSYAPETLPFFTNAGVDVYIDGAKALTGVTGYDISHKIDFNATGIYYKGLYVYEQNIPLEGFTGNSGDSIKFPAQAILYTTPRTIMQFPCTANSAWHSKTSRSVVDFTITVASAGLNNTPGQHVFTYTENDTVVGWGKLRVYTPNGASIPYDVLMTRYEVYANDSMYLGGAPAPAPLLTAFGITQGQKTNISYAENFHRKGSWYYLMRRFYRTDNTYSTLNASFINTDDVSTVGVADEMAYSSLVFPNPTNGSAFNVEVMGKNTTFSQYDVIDMMGRTVQSGKPHLNGMSKASISLHENLVNGTYFIKMTDANNRTIIMEKFDLIR